MDWKDLFGGVHEAGGALLSAFGAGGLVKPLEQLEDPILPDWAKSNAGGTAAVGVTDPDYVVVLRKGAKQGDTLADAHAVAVVGGKRFDGNGYKHGEPFGKHFSFGYDAPSRVDIATKSGKKASLTDVDKIIFCGGNEAPTKVTGEAIGWSDYDPWTMLYDPAGGLYRYLNQTPERTAFTPQAQTAYWSQQRAAQQPFLSTTRQRQQAAQQLQQALLAEKQARATALAQQAAASMPPPSMPSMPPLTPSVPDLFSTPPMTATADPNNPGFLTDGSMDPNYQTPSVVGRSDQMHSSDDLEILGAKVLTEAASGGPVVVNQTSSPVVACGDVRPNPVRSLLGNHARMCVLGTDVIGAPLRPLPHRQPQTGFVIKSTPKGRTFTSLVVNRQAKHNPKQTLKTARTVAKRMQQVGQRALTLLDKAAKTTKKTSVKGAIPSKRPRMTPAALRRLAQDLVASSKKLGETANKYEKTLTTLKQRQAAEQRQAQAVTKIHGSVVLGGDVSFEEIVGLANQFLAESVEILGDYGDPVPDPTNPGYLTDGTPDPNYGSGTATDGSTPPTASNMPGPPDYGAGSPPDINSAAPQPGVDYVPDPYPNGDDPTFYDCPTDDDLPLGAIIFDGSRQPPHMGVGNYTCYFGMVPGASPPKGGPYSGYSYHADGKWWLLLEGTQPSTNYSGGRNYDTSTDPSYAMVTESKKNNWGPLIGAPRQGAPGNPQGEVPTGGWTHGLRFSPSGPNGPRWFWFYDQAPDWAKQPVLQARLNDAIVAYQAAVAAGKTDFVNQQIQDQLDAQDAAKAAKAQAAVDAQVAQQQEIEQQKEAQQQAQLAQQQATFDEQAYEQQMALQQQMAQAEAQYAATHPDQYFGPQAAPPADQEQADDGGDLPPEMTNDGGESDFTPTNLDDSQIDWGE